jgi:predicted kinase
MNSSDRRPFVITIAGLPAAGKTSLAIRVASHTGCELVSRDEVRRQLFQPCEFTEREKLVSFRAVLLLTAAYLGQGKSCLVQGMTFSRVGELESVRDLALRFNARFYSFLLRVSADVAADRLARDCPTHPAAATNTDRRPSLAYEVALRMRTFPDYTIVLDGTLPVDETARQLEQVLARGEGC